MTFTLIMVKNTLTGDRSNKNALESNKNKQREGITAVTEENKYEREREDEQKGTLLSILIN